MLLTMEQAKYLDADGDLFRFVGQDQASPQERRDLKTLDDSYIDLYGQHMITNFRDLEAPFEN